MSLIPAGQAVVTGAGREHRKIEMLQTGAENWDRDLRRENFQGWGKAWGGVVQQGHARSVCVILPFPNCAAAVMALRRVPCLQCGACRGLQRCLRHVWEISRWILYREPEMCNCC